MDPWNPLEEEHKSSEETGEQNSVPEGENKYFDETHFGVSFFDKYPMAKEPEVKPAPLDIEWEPWMSLSPEITAAQWLEYKQKMSPREWVEYRLLWVNHYEDIYGPMDVPERPASRETPREISQELPFEQAVEPIQNSNSPEWNFPLEPQELRASIPAGRAALPQKKRGNKFVKTLGAIWPFFLYLAILMIPVFIASFVWTIMAIASGRDPLADMTESLAPTLLYISAGSEAIGLLVIHFLFQRDRKLKAQTIGQVATVPLAIGAVFLVYDLMALFQIILPGLFSKYVEMMEQSSIGPEWIQIVAMVLLAPVVEELLFRGVVLKRFQGFLPPAVALIVSSVCFGISHLNLIQGTYAFFLGLLLGWVYQRTNSIHLSILIHLLFNLSNYFMDDLINEFGRITGWYTVLDNLPVGIFSLIGVVLILLGMVLVFVSYPKEKQAKTDDEL